MKEVRKDAKNRSWTKTIEMCGGSTESTSHTDFMLVAETPDTYKQRDKRKRETETEIDSEVNALFFFL